MPPKTREYYLTTSSSRDFPWFPFRTLAPARPPRSKVELTPPHKLPKTYHTKMPSIEEEPGQALMAPADVKAVADAAKPKLGVAKPKKSKSKKPVPKSHGSWSDWYVSEDRGYFWRARISPNKTWDYQVTPGSQKQKPQSQPQSQPQPRPQSQSQSQPQPQPQPEPQPEPEPELQPESQPTQHQSESPATSSSSLNRPPSPEPDASLIKAPEPTSPKSSWPTIITTSTGERTNDISTSSTQTLTTLAKEVDDGNPAGPGTALLPVVIISNGNANTNTNTKNTKTSSPKRPVGPVMRLIQEGRSRKAKAKSEAAAAAKVSKSTNQGQGQGAAGGNNGMEGGGAVIVTKARTAQSKKLHARVKSEKELKVDPKRRVRLWLKDVEVEEGGMVLDGEGLPVYW